MASESRESGLNDWVVNDREVGRLTEALIRLCGVEMSQSVLALFKKLDRREVVSVGEIEQRDVRKKMRHLMEAFSLAVVDGKQVPGVKMVATAFKKPADCHLSLAKHVKPFLLQAVHALIDEENTHTADEQQHGEQGDPYSTDIPAQDDKKETQDDNEKPYDDNKGIAEEDAESTQQRIREALTDAALPLRNLLEGKRETETEGATEEGEIGKEAGPIQGMMSLEEYRKRRSNQNEDQVEYTRGEEAGEMRSLMEMRQAGEFKDSTVDLDKYRRARERTEGMWGQSRAKQQQKLARIEREEERAAARRQQTEEEEEDPNIAWETFDREKAFAVNKGVSKKGYDEFMEMAAERKAAFKRGT